MERKYYERRSSFSQCSSRNALNIQDFSVFDYLRTRFYTNDGSFSQQIRLYLCGATAGLTSLTLTSPLELVRVRLAM